MLWFILPLEIFETIKAPRLVNRALSEACTGPLFVSFIQQPTTDLSDDSLQSLEALASNPELKQKIHILTIMASAFDSSEILEILETKEWTVRNPHSPTFSPKEAPCTPEELAELQLDLDWINEQQAIRTRQSESPESIIDHLASTLRRLKELDVIQLNACVVHGRGKRSSTQPGEWHRRCIPLL